MRSLSRAVLGGACVSSLQVWVAATSQRPLQFWRQNSCQLHAWVLSCCWAAGMASTAARMADGNYSSLPASPLCPASLNPHPP